MIAKASALILLLAVATAGKAEAYFPTGALSASNKQSDDFRNEWYSKHLRAMSEPVLRANAASRSYRFTWLRTFHHPVSVRIVSSGGKYELFATELDGAGGYEPGKILRSKHSALTAAQFAEIESLITRQAFWSIPADGGRGGLDGSEWIVEGAIKRYRVVCAWTPESGPVRVIGIRFLKLTDWEFPAADVY